MSSILPLLPYVQVLLAALLIVAILLQQRGASLGGAFGGDNFSAAFYTRRGPELTAVSRVYCACNRAGGIRGGAICFCRHLTRRAKV
ncbi:MAG: hypothetical protein KatS3mg099_302 [Candidatus Parcubacteria bacterium]|nr:MAG: hypothetical protein KatS3mg099_302 [Candidatus Parcubacteria bacterium]